MRNANGLQKLLYLLMAVLGIYIVYKGGCILMNTEAVQGLLDSGGVQRRLEDAAMRSYAPGYTAAVEERESGNWLAAWMRQIVPVYSYLADGQAAAEAETGETGSAETGEMRSTEPGAMAETESVKIRETEDAGNAEVGEPESAEMREAEDSGNAEVGEPENAEMREAEDSRNAEAGEPENAEMRESKDLGNVEVEKTGKADAGAARADISGKKTETDTDSVYFGADGENAPDTDAGNTDSIGTANNTGSTEAQTSVPDSVPALSMRTVSEDLLHQLEDFDYLLNHYYTVDEGTMADAALLDADTLLQTDLRLAKTPDVPQILIYHTHSQEAFADSREGETEDTIVGMGETLAQELRDAYGYNVIHDTGVYDLVDGVLDRSAAYDYARASVEEILQEYPTIEVIIDLHRDGVDGQKFVTEIDGKPTSMIMFFNGISRDSQDQPLPWLENPYTQENLAFSLQLQLAAQERYPGFTRNIYLKAERFNLHLRPRSLLIEAGTQLNTVEEERNAMKPIAALLEQVLGS